MGSDLRLAPPAATVSRPARSNGFWTFLSLRLRRSRTKSRSELAASRHPSLTPRTKPVAASSATCTTAHSSDSLARARTPRRRRTCAGEPAELRASCCRSRTDSSALDDLRELSRGIHPAILAEGGLGPALKSLARRSLSRPRSRLARRDFRSPSRWRRTTSCQRHSSTQPSTRTPRSSA